MKRIFLISLISFFIYSCAKIGSPSGGTYDRTPPRLVNSKPLNNSVNFKGKGFELVFDEYIELRNSSEELLVSPPLKFKPSISSNLNKIKLEWKDTLRENTTYIFDFGSSIVDYNEGNSLKNFSFGFSTGDIIDTFYYTSKVLDAFTLKPAIKKNVMLYSTQNKEDVRTKLPNYITRTDSSGSFLFKNISSGDYLILVHDDKNQNFLYDLPNEALGFLNHRIKAKNDIYDTIKSDDIIYFNSIDEGINEIKTKRLVSKHRLDIVFFKPLEDSLYIVFDYPSINGLTDSNIFYNLSNNRDSISLFLNNFSFDSVKLRIGDKVFNEELDLYYKSTEKEKNSFSIRKSQESHPYYLDLLLELPYPIFDTSVFEVFSIYENDTSTINAYVLKDNPLFIKIDIELKQDSKYKFIIRDSLIYNRFFKTNDSLIFNIKIDSEKNYGNLIFNVLDTSNNEKNIILSLEDNNREIRKLIGKIGEKFRFNYLVQGQYRIKMIIDENSNNKWDEGDYFKNILPEKVLYYPKTINIRENWDIEEVWELK